MQRNWKNIFRLNKHSFIIVNMDSVKERLVFFLTHKQTLKQEKSFLVLCPETHEINQFSSGDYIKKYGLQIKGFLEKEEQSTLIIDEIILNAVIQPDKKPNFLRLLNKKTKKLVIFCAPKSNEDFLEHKIYFLLINKEKIEQEIKVFENFEIIRQRIAQTYNPFKNPQVAFEKIKGKS